MHDAVRSAEHKRTLYGDTRDIIEVIMGAGGNTDPGPHVQQLRALARRARISGGSRATLTILLEPVTSLIR